jgi:hypothetical protein
MGKLNVKNGTPVGSANLCESCNWGQCMTGYRESDRLVICNKTSPDLVVPFTVLECTCFEDKHRPNWRKRHKLARDIQPVRVSCRTAGFSTVTDARQVAVADEDDEAEDEAAIARSDEFAEKDRDTRGAS